MKLIKKKVLEKRAEAIFSKKLSDDSRKITIAEEIDKSIEEIEGELSRTSSRLNHEDLVIDTEIARAER